MQASRTASQLLIEETVPIGVEIDADGVVDEDQVVMVSIGVEIEITESE
jgi:prefoldin subunit 5